MTRRLRALAALLAFPIASFAASPADAQRLAPAEHYALRQRADSLAAAGSHAGAAEAYTRLAASEPRDGALWIGLATARAGQRRHREAAEAWERALALGFGRGSVAMYRVAQQYAFAGDADRAFGWLERSLAARLERLPQVAQDTAWRALRGDARFVRLAGLAADTTLSRDERWRADLRHLVAEAKRLHVGFDRPAHGPAFDAAARRLEARIPRLSDTQVLLEMRRLTALLGDGHSDISVAAARLPLDLYLFSDGLHVVRGHGDAARWAGSRVVRIGALPADSAVRAMAPLVGRDNDMGLAWIAPHWLTQPQVLLNIGAIADTAAVEMVLREPGGAERTVTFREAALRHAGATRVLFPAPSTAARPPLWLQRPDTAYWMAPLPEARAVYVQVNQIASLPGYGVGEFSDAVLAALRGAPNLIVDLRQNGGGNNFLNGALLTAAIAHERARPENRVFVLVSRMTFSAAQNLANDLDRLTGAVFVGEPTGSRPNFVGENAMVRLPYSGVQASISSRYHQAFDWMDGRAWIAPDVPAPLSSADYFAGRDPALEAVIEIVRAQTGR